VGAVLAGVLWQQLPVLGAGGLLHPARHATALEPPPGCVDREFTGADVTLRGWKCGIDPPLRGTVIYLHGIADNRGSAVGVVPRFLARGFNVVTYDSRAHGDSGGVACTYGFLEKQDLRHVIDTLPARPIVLIGTSLGAAVALQAAAIDRRIAAVVSAETFSDLRTVAKERAPLFFTGPTIDRAFQRAEREAGFSVDAVNPATAAEHITVPVLLLHGAADVDTPPAHSQRVFAALRGPKQLIVVPGAHHNQSLNAETWRMVEAFTESAGDNGSDKRSNRGTEVQRKPK
jgi:pimeloyl-ACP methyl ester carboxylesterase